MKEFVKRAYNNSLINAKRACTDMSLSVEQRIEHIMKYAESQKIISIYQMSCLAFLFDDKSRNKMYKKLSADERIPDEYRGRFLNDSNSPISMNLEDIMNGGLGNLKRIFDEIEATVEESGNMTDAKKAAQIHIYYTAASSAKKFFNDDHTYNHLHESCIRIYSEINSQEIKDKISLQVPKYFFENKK